MKPTQTERLAARVRRPEQQSDRHPIDTPAVAIILELARRIDALELDVRELKSAVRWLEENP